MRLNAKGQLGVGERCVEADGQGVKYAFCRLGTADGPWQYDEVSFCSFIMEFTNDYVNHDILYTSILICALISLIVFAEDKNTVAQSA